MLIKRVLFLGFVLTFRLLYSASFMLELHCWHAHLLLDKHTITYRLTNYICELQKYRFSFHIPIRFILESQVAEWSMENPLD